MRIASEETKQCSLFLFVCCVTTSSRTQKKRNEEKIKLQIAGLTACSAAGDTGLVCVLAKLISGFVAVNELRADGALGVLAVLGSNELEAFRAQHYVHAGVEARVAESIHAHDTLLALWDRGVQSLQLNHDEVARNLGCRALRRNGADASVRQVQSYT